MSGHYVKARPSFAPALVACAVVASATPAAAAIPVQPRTGPLAGCTPPGDGRCTAAPGEWFGTAGNDSVRIWVSAGGAGLDSALVVVNGGNCTVPRRWELRRRWVPARRIGGAAMPACTARDAAPCVTPDTPGYELEVRFPTASCALVELWLRDPAGRDLCPTPCLALDDIGVGVARVDWGRAKRLFR